MGWTEHALVVRANPEVSLIPRKTSIVKIAMTAPDSVLVTRFSSFASSPRLAMPDDAGSIRAAVEELLSTAGYERAAADPDEPFACGVLHDGPSTPPLADSVAELITLAVTLALALALALNASPIANANPNPNPDPDPDPDPDPNPNPNQVAELRDLLKTEMASWPAAASREGLPARPNPSPSPNPNLNPNPIPTPNPKQLEHDPSASHGVSLLELAEG